MHKQLQLKNPGGRNRGMERVIAVLLTVCCLLFSGSALALEKTRTGFYWPLDKFRYSLNQPTGRWLAPRRGGAAWHIGVDMFAPVGQPVRAVAEGTVQEISASGWGRGNIAVLIKHHLTDDSWFIALYGHLTKSTALCKGSRVAAGEVIGRVGCYPCGGSHLHFGVVAPGRLPVPGYGSTSKISHNNFIDPLEFLRSGRPGHEDGNSEAAVCLQEEEVPEAPPSASLPELRPSPKKRLKEAGIREASAAVRKAARSRRPRPAHALRHPSKKRQSAGSKGQKKKQRSRRPAAVRRAARRH